MNDSGSKWAEARRGAHAVVLCVDDDLRVLSALRRELVRESYEVVTATNAAQALGLLRHYPVDVVIADQRMPETTGTELLGEIALRWPRIGRVILTAYPGSVAADGVASPGIDALFHKPWDDEALRCEVRRLIGAAALEVEDAAPYGFDLGGEG